MAEDKQYISSQPKGTAPMQAGGNKNAKNIPIGPDGKREWSFGLFDCFSRCGLCCQSTFCPCVVYSKNRQRQRHLQQEGTPLPGGGETKDDHCFIFGALILTGYAWVLHINTRTEIREHYGIRGDTYGDCLTVWCCRPCSHVQERREIELEEGSF